MKSQSRLREFLYLTRIYTSKVRGGIAAATAEQAVALTDNNIDKAMIVWIENFIWALNGLRLAMLGI